MMVLLQREGSILAIEGKCPNGTSDFDKENIKDDALSGIQLFLAPNMLCETIGIKKNDDTLACALLFSLTSKDHDIENSMIHSKELISLEQVRQELNSCDVRRHFERDKDDEVRLFVKGHTSQQGRSQSKYRSKSHMNKKNMECCGCHNKGHFERDYPMSKSKEKNYIDRNMPFNASTTSKVRHSMRNWNNA
ncbi:hypothetical protein T459_11893 [Capsicum annuum]|uniref:CCHC-type domain-containing protein n=1 Tax=Capsicum annuum TaxID=4072 RepID=A0A2G2ZN79_CAPAN|nr:hypothetical protein T459_11893 [Capsicum annuum]